MFERFKGVIKGGASTVVEQSENLAGKVVGDHSLRPSELKDKLKEGAKTTFKGGKEFVSEGGDRIAEADTHEIKDKTKEVAHNVKHYGAFSEGYLGYSDPTKDLRKAVKAKEKAAKKAKKARKKQGKKGTEDLFDPANLAKYRKEIEEKRTLALEPSPGISPNSDVGEKSKQESPDSPVEKPDTLQLTQQVSQIWSNQASPDFGSPDFGSDEKKLDVKSPSHEGKTPQGRTPRDDEDWKKFLSSGVDDLIKKETEKLDEIKKDSYFQRKKTQVEIEEDAKVSRPTTLIGKRKKQWVDLDTEGFEETEGEVVPDVSDTEESEEAAEEESELEPLQQEVKKQEEEEEKEKLPDGYVDIPEDEPIDLDDDDDLFNTGFVDAIVSGDIVYIPESPVEEEGDDPFDTKFVDEICQKHEKEARVRAKVESNRIKFGSLAAAADVLSGKAEKVDKHNVDHALKKKRRRANRINLIAEELDDVTALEDIEGTTPVEDKPTLEIFDLGEDTLDIPVGDLLTSSPSPCIGTASPSEPQEKAEASTKLSDDLAEFDVVHSENVQLTSNVALLEAEFCPAEFEEEEDPFDEAFTQLAKASITKTKLDTLEADLYNDDLFDTSKADAVLGLASLVGVLDKTKAEEVVLDTFDDKDPFDTSAYDHITKDLEVDLEFESLAKRDPHELDCEAVIGPDPFDIIDSQLKEQLESANNEGWAAFGDEFGQKKPSRPPPPRPAPPRPAPPPPKVQVDYASGRNTPSVIVKAPSSDSIKSWNVGVAETLILKSEIEAIEAHAIEEALEEKEEFDPFDTTEFEEVVSGLKSLEEDPFDTSIVKELYLGPSKTELHLIEADILGEGRKGGENNDKSNLDLLCEEVPEQKGEATLEEVSDPFDTAFVEDLLPNKGDPFDTTHIKLGKTGPSRPGPPKKQEEVDEEDFEEDDPFDTTIADKVIPVRRPRVSQRSTISIEDEDFDPESTFVQKKQDSVKRKPPPPPRPSLPTKVVDPFSFEDSAETPAAKVLTPNKESIEETDPFSTENKKKDYPDLSGIAIARPRPKVNTKDLEKEFLDDPIGGALKKSWTDEDFDPRGDSPKTEKPPSPDEYDPDGDEYDPFDTSGIDPFDTSAVTVSQQ